MLYNAPGRLRDCTPLALRHRSRLVSSAVLAGGTHTNLESSQENITSHNSQNNQSLCVVHISVHTATCPCLFCTPIYLPSRLPRITFGALISSHLAAGFSWGLHSAALLRSRILAGADGASTPSSGRPQTRAHRPRAKRVRRPMPQSRRDRVWHVTAA